MLALLRTLLMLSILFSHNIYAEPVDDYVKVCIDNQANNMGPELCECMGIKAKELSTEEFDFFFGIAAKNQEKINTGHTALDANQKIKVMQLSMIGPSKCANELAAKQNTSNTQSSAESSTESSLEAQSESADSATQ